MKTLQFPIIGQPFRLSSISPGDSRACKGVLCWLERLCDSGALEIIPGEGHVLYIPFMMNDAAEVYCILTDVSLPAGLPADLTEITDVDLVHSGTRNGLILKCGDQAACSLWYADLLSCIRRQ